MTDHAITRSPLTRHDEHSVSGASAWSCEPVLGLRVVVEHDGVAHPGRTYHWHVVPLTVATRALGGVWCGGGDHLATGIATSLKTAARVGRACARAYAKGSA
jgi:hypothetical protein